MVGVDGGGGRGDSAVISRKRLKIQWGGVWGILLMSDWNVLGL